MTSLPFQADQSGCYILCMVLAGQNEKTKRRSNTTYMLQLIQTSKPTNLQPYKHTKIQTYKRTNYGSNDGVEWGGVGWGGVQWGGVGWGGVRWGGVGCLPAPLVAGRRRLWLEAASGAAIQKPQTQAPLVLSYAWAELFWLPPLNPPGFHFK